MDAGLQVITARQARCKCCGVPASLYGVVDFHKSCEIQRGKTFELSGIPVYYYRCPGCGFIFTTAFDHFTKEDFHRYVYNEEYILVDPDYQDLRPRSNAAFLCNLFAGAKPQRILDYGGGEGLLADLLRATGLFQVDTFDPFVPRHAARPPHRYDCVVSFEVVEHSTDPAGTFADMNAFLTDDGLILFSTLLQPAEIDQHGVNWWYAGPRNGHVSLFSRAGLLKVVQPFGFRLGSFNDNLHVLFRKVPPFAQRWINIP